MPDRRRSLWVIAIVGLALALALITRQGAAAQLGRLVGWLWVSTMDVVFRLIGALVGA